MSVGDGEVCESVELQPFPHQVGGHTTMFRYSQDTVCKPLCLREFHFYSTLPPELLPFTAECRGIVHVEVQGLGTENVRLLAHRVMGPGGDHLRSSQGSLQDSKVKGSKLKTNGELEDEPGIQSRQQNPWVQDVFTRQLRRLSPSGANKFLLLENMVAGFQKPCVLDLKMGRRQHGDDATPEKIQLFRERCATSTSNLLGVRASGMQVYQVDSGQFIFRNKYDGRALNSHEFKANLYQFLHNGLVLRQDLLAPIIEQLTQLRHVVENLPTFRFYSSSLLIMYEGVSAEKRNRGSSKHEHCDKKSYHVDETDSCGWCYDDRVIVKMVDFAHTTYKDFDSGDQNHTGPHSGYLFGLSTLITVFTELQQQHGNPKCQLAPDDSYDI